MTAELSNLLNKIRDARVLVVGDLMLDEFVEGHIDRISPEAPVPILTLDRRRFMPGGAANVAANISALGGKATLIGVVGDDSAGQKLVRLLCEDYAIEYSDVIGVSGCTTTHKTRYGAAGQHLLRVDEEYIAPIPDHIHDRIIGAARNALPSCQAMVLSDYGKGMFIGGDEAGFKLASHLVQLASGLRVPAFIDTKSRALAHFSETDVFKPNLAELAAVSEMPVRTEADIIAAARWLIDVYEFETVVVTLGRDGALLVTAESETSLEGSHRTVCDVSGAGDTFMAAMAVARASGHPMDTCGHFASLVAGISVGKVGTAVVTPEEVLATVGDVQVYRVGDPAIDKILAVWHQDNLKIAFTNGVFDLLHVDHIDYLRRCANIGQRLVVGLNSDASVRRQKGEDRPIVPADQRAAMLLALSYVDMVVIFDDDTPRGLIQHIRPAVLIKDSGYHPDEVDGAGDLAEWGGRLVLIDRGTRTSTTEIADKMRETMDFITSPLVAEAAEYKPVEYGHSVPHADEPDRAMDRALADAGYMPMSEYVEKATDGNFGARHRDIYGQARAWLYDEVMPWWRVNAWDKQDGGFYEGWTSVPSGRVAWWGKDKRIMVAARQTAVFSRWSEREDTSLGVHGWQYLLGCVTGYADGPGAGLPHSTGDGHATLYDQAFVLLACAERYKIEGRRLMGSSQPLTLARSIVTFLDANMAAPEGYYSEITAEGQVVQSPRHQDPHMHLLEAFIALYEATGGAEWLDQAEGIVELARKRFIREGVLYEEFHQDWSPVCIDVSPGHHFEWVWLLLEMRRLAGGGSYGHLAAQLFCKAVKWINPETGGMPYNVQPDGTVTDARRRLWSQCEALRAHHVMASYFPAFTVAERRDKLLTTILRDHANGPVWHEWLEADGTPIDAGTVPASSLYHLFFCLDYVLTDMEKGDG